jgi:hypothetical protein
MPNWRRRARHYAQAAGIDPDIFEAQINQESGFRTNVSSGAGAQGIAQIMPATARGWGVNPHDPDASLRAAAHHMAAYLKQFGSYQLALAAYNAGPGNARHWKSIGETRNYVNSILNGRHPSVGSVNVGSLGSATSAPKAPEESPLSKFLTTMQRMNDAVPQLGTTQFQSPLSSPFGHNPLGLGQPGPFGTNPIGQGRTPGDLWGNALADTPGTGQQQAMLSAGITPYKSGTGQDKVNQGIQDTWKLLEVLSAPKDSGSDNAPTGGLLDLGGMGGKRGKLIGKPIDRPGARTSKAVLGFVSQIAGIYGHAIRLGTGTQHSRMTVNGNVSDHWSGHAIDLPATGQTLIRMGQAALIAAGMDPRKARKQRGGLYNVGGHQIIFNTHEGGDHTNHLHVSV